MRSLYYPLLIIGILGMLASIYSVVISNNWTNAISGAVCGACLLFGAWQIRSGKWDQKGG